MAMIVTTEANATNSERWTLAPSALNVSSGP
jgi:hypothetical protein